MLENLDQIIPRTENVVSSPTGCQLSLNPLRDHSPEVKKVTEAKPKLNLNIPCSGNKHPLKRKTPAFKNNLKATRVFSSCS